MKQKRGQQGAGGAAGVVAVIAGLIVLYILLLPPNERADLLDDNNDNNNDNGNDENVNYTILLEENPGRLDYLKGDEFEIELNAFNLYKTTESKIIESFNDFSVRNGWFDKKDAEKKFYVDDLDNTENILFGFNTGRNNGVLKIDLNEETIYEGGITTANVEPIKLKKQDLKVGENIISFSVTGVGIAFWRTNEYNIENAKIVGEVSDVSRQKTSNIFTLETWKYNALDRAYLKFSPECKQNEVGVLDVFVNDINVFSGVPDCGLLNKYVVPLGAFESGVNSVIFKTNKGSYLIDRIIVDIKLKDLTEPLYWFEITKNQEKNITDGDSYVNLTIEFVDDYDDCNLYKDVDCDKKKNLIDLNVNGHLTRIDQKEAEYLRNITSWVEKGQNYVKIIPRNSDTEIVELRVLMIESDEDDED